MTWRYSFGSLNFAALSPEDKLRDRSAAVFVLGLRGGLLITSIQAAGCGAEWRQQVVEERDGGVRIDGGAIAEGLFPSGLENCGQVFAHPLGGVGVQAAHPGNLMS